MKSRIKAAIYARVSTTNQSLGPQLTDLKRYAKARGINVYKVYADKGISGAKEKRPALDDLMADARKRFFNTVSCCSPPRVLESILLLFRHRCF
jgi:site-specific DNA recombinase